MYISDCCRDEVCGPACTDRRCEHDCHADQYWSEFDGWTETGTEYQPADPEPISVPGVYDIPADQYHAHPALSSSGARRLLPPGCPALFRHEQDNPTPHKREFDFGHAAHKLILGAGPDLVSVKAPDWRTKAAKEQRDAAYETGAVPLLAEEYERVMAMADALNEHPLAGPLFDPGRGVAEQALFWNDQPTGVPLRALVDWRTGRLVVDYKSTTCASPDAIVKTVHNYGYFQQGAFYLDGVRALGLAEDPAFVLVFQEKAAPYLVTVVQLDDTALRIGAELNRRAIEVFRDCTESGIWPGYATDITLIGLPAWAERRLEESFA